MRALWMAANRTPARSMLAPRTQDRRKTAATWMQVSSMRVTSMPAQGRTRAPQTGVRRMTRARIPVFQILAAPQATTEENLTRGLASTAAPPRMRARE
jgi:hypothetical protein